MTTASDLEAQAAEWLVKRDGGAMSAEEQAQFDAWLASDTRARAVYVRLETAWQRSSALMRRLKPFEGGVDVDLLARSPLSTLSAGSTRKPEQLDAPSTEISLDEYSARAETGKSLTPTQSKPVSPIEDAAVSDTKRRRWAIPLAAAAALVIVAVGAVTWLSHERNGWQEYSTDFGGLERIVLDDGSVVSLNTNSVMRVHISPQLRHIILERGEALFKVAHDKSRPFDVEAGNTVVRAVGTEFSVRVRDPAGTAGNGKDVEVLVKEGRVAIDPPKTQKPLERAAVLPASTSTLSAGEAVVISAKRVRVEKVADVEVDRKLSWTEGRLWFERQTLKDVVAEFNRYNRRQMVIADPAIENLRIGGGFEATDPESFIAALERTLGVRAFPVPSSGGGEAEVIRLVGTQETQH